MLTSVLIIRTTATQWPRARIRRAALNARAMAASVEMASTAKVRTHLIRDIHKCNVSSLRL